MRFEEGIETIQKRDKCSRFEAMQKARREFPEEHQTWEANGRELAEKAAQRPETPAVVRKLEGLVAETAREHGLSHCDAMEKVRRDYPQAYELYQDA